MKHYHNNKLYISTDELARTFTRDYEFTVTPYHINRLCHHYKVLHIRWHNMNFFSSIGVMQVRTMKTDFMDYLKSITNQK